MECLKLGFGDDVIIGVAAGSGRVKDMILGILDMWWRVNIWRLGDKGTERPRYLQ